MSDELRLPDDLAACEARLAARSPAPTKIDRDQLMYQAGWAACEASQAAINPLLLTVGTKGPHGSNGGKAIAAWSFGSAALAASLAVAVTLHVQPPQPPQVAHFAQAVATGHDSKVPEQVETTSSEQRSRGNYAALPSLMKHGDAEFALRQASPLIAMRALSIRESAEDPTRLDIRPATAAPDDVPAKTVKSAWQLLHDYLPGALAPAPLEQRRPFWLWNSIQSGETI